MSPDFTVYIVDDDASVRDALGVMLGVEGYRVGLFADAESFLKAVTPQWRGCLLLDIRMPGMDGLELQDRLRSVHAELPVIVMTGHGDVESSRRAFRALAVDFLEKPLDRQRLFQSITEAFARQTVTSSRSEMQHTANRRLATLTPREYEVMAHVVAGRHNREIAGVLGISPRTVEIHKARMMEKMGATSIPDLVRLTLDVVFTGSPPPPVGN